MLCNLSASLMMITRTSRVEAQLGEHVGRSQRMVDKRLAALAGLAPVGRVGRVVGFGDQLLRPLRPVGRHLLDKRRYGYARCRYRPRTFLCAYGFHGKIISARRFAPCQHACSAGLSAFQHGGCATLSAFQQEHKAEMLTSEGRKARSVLTSGARRA